MHARKHAIGHNEMKYKKTHRHAYTTPGYAKPTRVMHNRKEKEGEREDTYRLRYFFLLLLLLRLLSPVEREKKREQTSRSLNKHPTLFRRCVTNLFTSFLRTRSFSVYIKRVCRIFHSFDFITLRLCKL